MSKITVVIKKKILECRGKTVFATNNIYKTEIHIYEDFFIWYNILQKMVKL